MHDVERYFSPNYQEARHRFMAAAQQAGYSISRQRHPLPGHDGQTLWTDVARKGPARANVLITTSGIHGIEGYAGSAAQIFCIENGMADPSSDLAVVHVHALNPYGFDFNHRVNENNVDLNRNFIDWSAQPPENHHLNEEIQAILKSEPGWRQRFQIAAFIAGHGWKQTKAALTQGQYADPEGLFYGGAGPEWSNRLWRNIIAEHTMGSHYVAHIDFHTGLGPYGQGELIVPDQPSSDMFRRAELFWGSVTSPYTGDSASSPVRGDMSEAFRTAAGRHAIVTTATLEFGTLPPLQVLKALMADNRARHSSAFEQRAEARKLMRGAFNPADTQWQNMVLGRSGTVLVQARNGLYGSPIL